MSADTLDLIAFRNTRDDAQRKAQFSPRGTKTVRERELIRANSACLAAELTGKPEGKAHRK